MIVLRVLNDCTIITATSRITPNSKVLFSLGCYLIAERGKFIPRRVLMGLFWPHVSATAARHSLRRALWQLRRYGFPLISESELSLFLAKDAAQLDVDLLVNEHDASLANRPFEILPWFTPRGSADFRDWVDDFRYVIQTRIVLHLLDAASRAKSRADWQSVVLLSEQTLKLDPDCEMARTNATRARQFLRSRYLPRTRARSQLMLSAYESAVSSVSVLGEAPPPTYLDSRTVTMHEMAAANHSEDLAVLLTMFHEVSIRRDEHQSVVSRTTTDHTDHRTDPSYPGKSRSGTGLHLWGDEEIGKSLILQEFTTIAEAKGALILTTTFQAQHARTPLSALTTIIAPLLNSPGAAGCHPKFKSLLVQGASHSPYHTQTTSNLFPALADLIEAVADEQPLVLIFENIHHADTASIEVLNRLVPHLATHPVFLIGTSVSPNESLSTWTRSRHLRTNEHHWFPLANDAYNGVANTKASLTHRFESGALLCNLASAMGDTSRIRYAQLVLLPLCASLVPPVEGAVTTPSSQFKPSSESHLSTAEIAAALQFQTISHTLIGDSSIATHTAQRLLALARQSYSGGGLFQTLLFCANCLHWCGAQDTPSAVYQETFSRATREKSPLHAMQAAQGLAKLFLDRGNTRAAHTWANRTQAFIPATLSLWERHTLLLLQIQVALAHHNASRAEFLFQSAMDVLNAPLLGVQASAKACHLRLLLLQGTPEPVIRQRAEELLSLCAPLHALRVYHYEFFSLYLAYTHIGDQERGMQILRNYLEMSQLHTTLPSHEIRSAAQECRAK